MPDGVKITVAGTVNVDVIRIARHDIDRLCEAGDVEQTSFTLASVFLAFAFFFLGPIVAPGQLPAFWDALCHIGSLGFGILFVAYCVAWRRHRKRRLAQRDAMLRGGS